MSEQLSTVQTSHGMPPYGEQFVDLGGNQIPDQVRELVAQQRAGYEQRGLPFAGGNMLSMVHYYNRHMQGGQETDWRQSLMEAAAQSEVLSAEMQVDNPVDPNLVQGLLDAGIQQSTTHEGVEPGVRPLVYETVEDRQAAADQLIEERLAQAESYPYYDLYRQQGMLREEEGRLPYVELYRSTNGNQTVQLAGGLRSGVFTTDELTKLPPSVRLAATGVRNASKIELLETVFSMDQAEAYTIGDSGHPYSAYLSASRVDSDKYQGDTVLKIQVPACLTLPVEFLQAPVEQFEDMRHATETGRPMGPILEDREKEIAILGQIRPEWVVAQRIKSGAQPESPQTS